MSLVHGLNTLDSRDPEGWPWQRRLSAERRGSEEVGRIPALECDQQHVRRLMETVVPIIQTAFKSWPDMCTLLGSRQSRCCEDAPFTQPGSPHLLTQHPRRGGARAAKCAFTAHTPPPVRAPRCLTAGEGCVPVHGWLPVSE